MEKTKWEEIHNLPIEKFDELARQQTLIYPDLLKIIDEEEVINSFYDHYKRKRV
jgi:hypothetical protein